MRFLLILGLLAGCAVLNNSNRDEMLRVVREYNDGIRWGRYDQVTPRLAQDQRRRFLDRLGGAEELEILDYDISSIDILPNNKAQVRVQVTWSLRTQGIARRTEVLESWEQRGISQWQVVKQVRVRGAPLFLFDEPPPTKAPSTPL